MALESKPSDQDLLELIAQDDTDAFNCLYNRYWKKLLSFAAQKTGDIDEAENIVQDVFVSLWNRRLSLVITSSFENYLIVSVKYRVIKLLNKQRTERLHSTSADSPFDLIDDSTQEYLSFEELRHKLEQLVCQLPEKSQLIYRLNKQEGMSYKTIAKELDITEKSVEAHLYRATKTIREALRSFLTITLL